MELFKRKLRTVPPIWHTGDQPEFIPAQPNFESVLEWLVGLSEDDYIKVTKVAEINRKAYADSQAALGEVPEPSTFIKEPMPPMVAPGNFLDDDDELSTAFIEDELPQPTKSVDGVKNTTKVKVK